jgi:deazaflavin-dependent oxidoreductase (nitroreductase family)
VVEKLRDVRPPSGFGRWLFRLPLALYRVGLGWLLGSRFVRIEHKGRVTGKSRQVVLEVVDAEEPVGTYYVVAAWGERADWFRNIKANPEITYQVGRRRFRGRAEELPREEAERVFIKYGRKHPHMLQELMRFVGYRIDRDDKAYRTLAEHMPVVKLSTEREEAV